MRASGVRRAACRPYHPGRTERRKARSREPWVVCTIEARAWAGLSGGGSWFLRGWALPTPCASADPSLGVVLRPMCIGRTKSPKPCSVGWWSVLSREWWVGMGSLRGSSWFSRGVSLAIPSHSRSVGLGNGLRTLGLINFSPRPHGLCARLRPRLRSRWHAPRLRRE